MSEIYPETTPPPGYREALDQMAVTELKRIVSALDALRKELYHVPFTQPSPGEPSPPAYDYHYDLIFRIERMQKVAAAAWVKKEGDEMKTKVFRPKPGESEG